MKVIIALVLISLVLVVGCAKSQPVVDNTPVATVEDTTALDEDTALNEIDESFLEDTDDVEIGEMI